MVQFEYASSETTTQERLAPESFMYSIDVRGFHGVNASRILSAGRAVRPWFEVVSYRRFDGHLQCIELVRISLNVSVTPVSYTHLDVYKRQRYI